MDEAGSIFPHRLGIVRLDVNVGEQLAIESASPARGRGGFGRTGLFEPSTEKRSEMIPGSPVPQTDTGG